MNTSAPSLPQSIGKFLREHLPLRTRILVAVSGGSDSVTMAHVLKNMPWPIHLGHVDHQLRKESKKDAEFVRKLGQKWDIGFSMERIRIEAHASKGGLGIEEAARELRYQALLRMAHKAGCAVVATAHTADDQAETVLLNWLRGSGPGGLAGIPSMRQVGPDQTIQLIRPMLAVSRKEVLAYLKDQNVPHREDPTNRNRRFSRNRIRHETLPYLSRYYPGLSNRLVQAADIFREEEVFWQQGLTRELSKTVRKNGKKIAVDLTHLLGYHKALGRRILRHLLPGLSFQEIERVFTLAHSPKAVNRLELAGGVFVTRQADTLVIAQRNL